MSEYKNMTEVQLLLLHSAKPIKKPIYQTSGVFLTFLILATMEAASFI